MTPRAPTNASSFEAGKLLLGRWSRLMGAMAGLGVALPGTLVQTPPAHRWKLLYRQEGLSVYRDDSQILPVYKAEGLIDANVFDLLAVLSDISRRTQWVKDLEESRIIEGNIESKVIIYEQYHLPWPCQNRDSLVESTIHQDLGKLEVSVEYHQVASAKAPVRSGVTRMPVVRGSMLFRYAGKDRSYARVVVSLDVGGHLPDWAVSRFVRRVPVMTLRGLVRQVKRTRGEYARFVRIHAAEARQVARIPFELDDPADGGAP